MKCSVSTSDWTMTDMAGRVRVVSGGTALHCLAVESPSASHPIIWQMMTALRLDGASCFVYYSRLYLFLWLHGQIVPNYCLGGGGGLCSAVYSTAAQPGPPVSRLFIRETKL